MLKQVVFIKDINATEYMTGLLRCEFVPVQIPTKVCLLDIA